MAGFYTAALSKTPALHWPGLSPPCTIYQRMSEGRFPKSRSLGPKCAVWIESEIDAWIASVAGH
ncbi:helix-turn-helix transcriptional regulator [Sphingobium mellinum]|uniref:helix-turn-helix transcriptional regulator n=1 Tax=Sphingobium mellinum TaxID=1387166 RepID=UPI003BF58238